MGLGHGGAGSVLWTGRGVTQPPPTPQLLPTGLTGLEPATSAVTGRCSNQLNYRPWFVTFFYYARSATFWGQVL